MSAVDTDTDIEVKLKVPSLYKVIILNDDFTPMDFVIEVLIQIFNKTPAEAEALTITVHKEGRGICGIYSKEIADTKVLESNRTAQRYQHPLKTIAEKA